MRCVVLVFLSLFVVASTGCSNSRVRSPQTPQEAWQSAISTDSIRGYEKFIERYPNSEYEEQAKMKLSEAQKHHKELIVEISKKAEEVKRNGGKTWSLQSISGETVVLYEGMSRDLVEEVLGTSLGFPRMEGYRIEGQSITTGRFWVFSHGGLLEDIR